MSRLDEHIEEILDLIIEGWTYREMADKFGVSLALMCKFLTQSEHLARANAARKLSGSIYTDKAEQALKNAPADQIEIARARELAHHYRWKASKVNPREFGDKLDVTSDNKPLISEPLKLIIVPPNDDAGE